jgi:hypothetical protein
MITEQELLNIKQDFAQQQIFLHTIIAMIDQIGISKRNVGANDLETGFKLGEVFRMLHEFNADSTKLQEEILEKLTEVSNERVIKPTNFIYEQR